MEKLKEIIKNNNELSLDIAKELGISQDAVKKRAERNSLLLLDMRLEKIYKKNKINIKDFFKKNES